LSKIFDWYRADFSIGHTDNEVGHASECWMQFHESNWILLFLLFIFSLYRPCNIAFRI
jgi:hypothetical protein